MSSKKHQTSDKHQINKDIDLKNNEIQNQSEASALDEKQSKDHIVEAQQKLEQELDKAKDSYLRLLAEFDNFKKRSAKERIEWIKTANEATISSLLPILDDFERGLSELAKDNVSEAQKGFEMIYKKLKDTLTQNGLSEIDTKKGDDFSTDFHEAIAQTKAEEEHLKGKIMDVVQKGYKLGEKVIRYARVVVGH